MSGRAEELVKKHCEPCEAGTPPLSDEKIQEYLRQLPSPWEVQNNRKIWRTFKFDDFDEAMFFVNEVAATAESENHHPDIHIHYNKVVIELWTHAIGGLSENDFILASKIEHCQ